MKIIVHSAAVLIMAIITGCAGLPNDSRTGKKSVVTIADDSVTPRDTIVRSGDEIQFVNSRSNPVWVYFSRDQLNELSCERGFSYFWGVEETAKIKPNQSASLCFGKPGEYGYWVQSQPTTVGGARAGKLRMPPAIPGAVVVESSERDAR